MIIPLLALRAEPYPWRIEPAELAGLGPFMILRGYYRPGLEETPHGLGEAVFTIELLTGELHRRQRRRLMLAAFEPRLQVIDLLRRHPDSVIGPCELLARHLDVGSFWSFAAELPDGSTWDQWASLPDRADLTIHPPTRIL